MNETHSGIVIPGPGALSVPVDPDDPTKGTMQPVFTAQELTAAVINLKFAVEDLAASFMQTDIAFRNALFEAGDMLEKLSICVVALTNDLGDRVEDNGMYDESVAALTEWIYERAKVRAEAMADAERQAEQMKGDTT